jgi:hypothetical protein
LGVFIYFLPVMESETSQEPHYERIRQLAQMHNKTNIEEAWHVKGESKLTVGS